MMERIEGVGTITEVYGSECTITIIKDLDNSEQFPDELAFNLGITINNETLDSSEMTGLIDLSEKFFAGDTVAFMAERSLDTSSESYAWAVRDVTPLPDGFVAKKKATEEYGTIVWSEDKDGGGKVQVEKWGELSFDCRALCYASEWERNNRSQGEYRRHRTVAVRSLDEKKVLSISPLGKMYHCNGVVTKVSTHYCTIHSLAFGSVHFPFSTFIPPKELRNEKKALFQRLYGLQVDAKIVDTLPSQDSYWRTVAVFLPKRNMENLLAQR